jgi:peptidoglycan LD-endopeptidase CwlK
MFVWNHYRRCLGALIAALILTPPDALGQPSTDTDIPTGLLCLAQSYPEQIERVDGRHLYFKDGTSMNWDDGRNPLDFQTRLNQADLKDQMSQAYPLTFPTAGPQVNHDPGRIRHQPFFDKMYGQSEKQAREKLVEVRWMPGLSNRKVRFTTVNNVHKQIEKVSAALEKLPRRFHKYLSEPSSFNFRMIRKTKRKSMHSYGIAIDVGVEYADFWRWAAKSKGGTAPYRNRIPEEIVEVFQRHGFIWGGKWYHFDTMHFEYRPELLHPLCAEDTP